MHAPTLEQREAMRQCPTRLPIGYQRWSNLLFAHWEIDPAQIQASLPSGLYVDSFQGRAFLGIVPFFMDRVRPSFLPPLPWVSWFLELNLRTYVHDGHGRSGVWFYSLDCNQPIAVQLARRFFHLPYFHARMAARREGSVIDYRCQRSSCREARFRWSVAADCQRATPGSLEYFLLERYTLFAVTGASVLYHGRVHHEPYQYSPTKVSLLSTEPARLAGFDLNGDPCSLLAAKHVDVQVFTLQRV